MRDSIGLILAARGDLAGAVAHLSRSYEIFLKALGPDHPDTNGTKSELDRLLSQS